MAILPTTIIDSEDVRAILGAANNTWSHLCSHANINKWSRWKPIRSSKTEPLTEADLIAANCGLDRDPQTQVIYYRQPRGGAYSEYFRIGDFRGYNSLATPPVTVQVIEVSGHQSGVIMTSPPFVLVKGDDYTIAFKLFPGDIDPSWINPETSRIKNTDVDGGYGGVTWSTHPSRLVDEERLPSQVFTCDLLNPPTYTQRLNGVEGEIRMQYCYYKNSYIDKYGTTPHYIEDDGYSNSYRSLFEVRNILAGINFSYAYNLQYLLSQLFVRIGLYNNELYALNVKVKLEYKRLETGTTYNFDSGAFTLAAGYNSNRFFGPLTGWSVGYNSYEIKVRLYRIKTDLSEVEISYRMDTASITIASEG